MHPVSPRCSLMPDAAHLWQLPAHLISMSHITQTNHMWARSIQQYATSLISSISRHLGKFSNILTCCDVHSQLKKHICSFPPSAAIDYSSVREVRLSPCRIGDSFEFSGASKLALCIYGVSICQRSTLQRANVKHFFSFQGILFRIPGLCIDLCNNVLPLQMNKTLYGGNDQTLFRTHSIPTAAIVSCPSLDSDLHKTQKGLMLKVHSYTFIL